MLHQSIPNTISLIEENIAANRYINAAFLAEDLLNQYIANNENKKNAKEIKQRKEKLREYHKLSQSHYQHQERKIKIKKNEWEKKIKGYENIKEDKLLYERLSYEALVEYTKLKEKITNESSPIFILLSTVTTTDGKGNIVTQNNPEEYWLNEQFGHYCGISLQDFHNVFRELILRGRISPSSIMTFLLSKGVFASQSSYMKVSHGLGLYFSGEIFGAGQTLIPAIEEIMLNIFTVLGLDTISLPRAKQGLRTRDISINQTFFEDEKSISLLGEDFCYQISYILYNENGYNLRNKVTHGDIAYEQLNSNYFVGIIVRCLLMIATSTEPKKNK